MLNLEEVHRQLYRLLQGKVTLHSFEQWLYDHNELEELIGPAEYLQFISRDYSDKYALHETCEQIEAIIDPVPFEQERILSHLQSLLQLPDDYLEILEVSTSQS